MYVCLYVCTCVHLWLYVCVCDNKRMCIAISSFPHLNCNFHVHKIFCKKKKEKKKKRKKKENEQIHGFMKLFPEDICDYLYTTHGESENLIYFSVSFELYFR